MLREHCGVHQPWVHIQFDFLKIGFCSQVFQPLCDIYHQAQGEMEHTSWAKCFTATSCGQRNNWRIKPVTKLLNNNTNGSVRCKCLVSVHFGKNMWFPHLCCGENLPTCQHACSSIQRNLNKCKSILHFQTNILQRKENGKRNKKQNLDTRTEDTLD